MEELTPETKRPLRLSKTMRLIMGAQLVLMAYSGLTSDGSYGHRMCFHASLGYFAMLACIGHQRANAPTKADAFLVATGFFLWLPVAVAVEAAVRRLFFGGV